MLPFLKFQKQPWSALGECATCLPLTLHSWRQRCRSLNYFLEMGNREPIPPGVRSWVVPVTGQSLPSDVGKQQLGSNCVAPGCNLSENPFSKPFLKVSLWWWKSVEDVPEVVSLNLGVAELYRWPRLGMHSFCSYPFSWGIPRSPFRRKTPTA